MFSKDIEVSIQGATWGKRPRPTWAAPQKRLQSVDVGKALLLLGSITTPTGLLAGSPERYWACIRYFSACATSADLRVAMPFTRLDPHQRGVLSDDFGVAISTSWLVDVLGGVRDIVDGRQFILNMGVHANKNLPKVGPSKCPDFVLEDNNGRFHVLECKGTQSSISYLGRAMKRGWTQKHGIRVEKTIRGERLVIGLYLADERGKEPSQLVVIDPVAEPLLVMSRRDKTQAEEVLARLRIARALNLVGFPRMAFEISWPMGFEDIAVENTLLTQGERKFLSIGYDNREPGLMEEVDLEFRRAADRQDRGFIVQRMQFELPAVELNSGNIARRVTVVRGVSADTVLKLVDARSEIRAAAVDEAMRIAASSGGIQFSETESKWRLEYPGFYFSEFQFD